jgi:hypothetical protein
MAVLWLLLGGARQASGGYISLVPPGTVFYPGYPSRASAIDGNNVVGSYFDKSGNEHGFLYNGSTYISLDMPGSVPGTTDALRISGNNVVGEYGQLTGATLHYQTYLYNISTSTYTPINPGFVATTPTGVSGNNVVGVGGNNSGGFLYNGSTFDPAMTSKFPTAIDGNNVVGPNNTVGGNAFLYKISTSTFSALSIAGYPTGISGAYVVGNTSTGGAFLYNISTSTSSNLSVPGAVSTVAQSISGNTVGGFYSEMGIDRGFLYDISTSTFTILSVPGVTTTTVLGVSGNDAVGYYLDSYGVQHAYLYDPNLPDNILPPTLDPNPAAPEPATLTMLAIGIAAMAGYGWRRRQRTDKLP